MIGECATARAEEYRKLKTIGIILDRYKFINKTLMLSVNHLEGFLIQNR
jgi:hypothetical protein